MKIDGGIIPTLLDLPEMWRLNSTRCDGRFNLYFFWLYPLVLPLLLPYTLLCVAEALLNETPG